MLYRSARNLPGVSVIDAAQASTLDLMGARTLIVQEGAIEALTEALRPATKPSATDATPTDAATDTEA